MMCSAAAVCRWQQHCHDVANIVVVVVATSVVVVVVGSLLVTVVMICCRQFLTWSYHDFCLPFFLLALFRFASIRVFLCFCFRGISDAWRILIIFSRGFFPVRFLLSFLLHSLWAFPVGYCPLRPGTVFLKDKNSLCGVWLEKSSIWPQSARNMCEIDTTYATWTHRRRRKQKQFYATFA